MSKDSSEGQVSEVSGMSTDVPEEPISDSQGVAGNPEGSQGDHGGPIEAGPNSKPTANVESGPEDPSEATRK